MIDFENEIYTAVSNKVKEEYPSAFVSGEYVPVPKSYPAITFYAVDNSLYTKSLDSSGEEKHARQLFQCDVYSNLKTGKKSQSKAILGVIDDVLRRKGLIRNSATPMATPNADNTIYRITARYSAVIDKNGLIFTE